MSEPAKRKVAVKPVHVVTIAAGAGEADRLDALATVLPHVRMRIVSGAAAAKAKPDFSIVTTFDPVPGRGATRLFTERLHVVAGARVHDLQDLQGKVVSFGPDGGQGQEAARRAFAALGIVVKETPLELGNALDGLASGDVDAAVILAPDPVADLAKIKGGDLHLVAWPSEAAAPIGAEIGSIDPAAYPGLNGSGTPVRALSVGAVMAMNGHAEREPTARLFLAALEHHAASLSKHGFDLVKADVDSRHDRKVASADRR